MRRAQVEEERRTLDRVRKLIALAASSENEEARTAASTACRLIRENAFLIAPGHAVSVLKKHDEVVDRNVVMIESCMERAKKRHSK